MLIRIDKKSDVPIRNQLSEQIVFLIATGALKPDEPLPSVRQLAMRHHIHPNTVSEAYQELVQRHWLKRHRGKKMAVRPFDDAGHARGDLDDLIDDVIRTAVNRGYTLQQLQNRMRERLLVTPPDHVLIVEDEPGLRRLLHRELSTMLPRLAIEAVSPDDLAGTQGPAIGSLVVTLPGRVWNLVVGNPPLIPRGHPLITIEPCAIDTHLDHIRKLKQSSVIGVVSISQVFLQLARALLAPVIGDRHAMEEHLLNEKEGRDLTVMDLVICDTATVQRVKSRQLVPYRLVSIATARKITDRISSSKE
jgi:DNA-binding transcriptional regulator YhcF (GntR family)